MNSPGTDLNGHAPFALRGHEPSLDGIRGLAVLLVFFHHSIWAASLAVTSKVDRVFQAVVTSGWMGVDIFFALSGFLITGILLDSKGSNSFFLNFYAKRTLRIFPLYYLVLVMTFVVLAPTLERVYSPGDAFAQIERNQAWFWFYLENWYFVHLGAGSTFPLTHFWSLAVEEQFYLIWPLIIFLCSVRRTLWVAAGVCIAAPLIRLVLISKGWPEVSVYMATITRMDALLAGALLASWLRCGYPAISPKTCAIALIGIFVGGMAVTGIIDHGLSRNGLAVQTIGFSIIPASAALLILLSLSLSRSSSLNNVLTHPALVKCGKYSYAMYVFHPLIQWSLAALLRSHGILLKPEVHLVSWNYLVFALLTLACTYLTSVLSWYLIERHFLNLKKHFVGSSNRQPPQVQVDT
jgi:peptidoglycan/LPS O-acetylase OafA/YrhL